MFRAVCFFISTSEKGYFFSLNKQFLSHFPWTLLRHGWVPAMSVCPHTKKADHWSVEQNGAVKQLLFLRTLSSCSWTKAEQTRLLVAAISFFFSPPPPRSNSSVVRISYSMKQDQPQPGRLAGGGSCFCSPFHFFYRMKEVLRLFQAESFSTPSFTRLWSQTETLEMLPNKELSHGLRVWNQLEQPPPPQLCWGCSSTGETHTRWLLLLSKHHLILSGSLRPSPFGALAAQGARHCSFPETLQQGCWDFNSFFFFFLTSVCPWPCGVQWMLVFFMLSKTSVGWGKGKTHAVFSVVVRKGRKMLKQEANANVCWSICAHTCMPPLLWGRRAPTKEQIPDCSDTAVTSALKAPWDPIHSDLFQERFSLFTTSHRSMLPRPCPAPISCKEHSSS